MFEVYVPDYILYSILRYLTPPYLALACQVSKAWNVKCDDNQLWRPYYIPISTKYYPKPQPGVEDQTGYVKNLYIFSWKDYSYVCDGCKSGLVRSTLHLDITTPFRCRTCYYSKTRDLISVNKALKLYRLKEDEIKGLERRYKEVKKRSVQKKRHSFCYLDAIEQRAFIKWGKDYDLKLQSKKKKDLDSDQGGTVLVDVQDSVDQSGKDEQSENTNATGSGGGDKKATTTVIRRSKRQLVQKEREEAEGNPKKQKRKKSH